MHRIQLSGLYIGDNMILKAGEFQEEGMKTGVKTARRKRSRVGEWGKWSCHHLRGQSAQETDTFLSESEGERDVPWGGRGHRRFWWCQILNSRGHRTWGEGNKGWKRGIRVWEIKSFLHVGPLIMASESCSTHNETRSEWREAEIGDSAEMRVALGEGWLSEIPWTLVDRDEEIQGNGILSKYIYFSWSPMMEVIYNFMQQRNIIYT